MGRTFTRTLRTGTIALAAMLLGGAALAQGDRYEVILFQEGGAPALADLHPRVLPIAQIAKPEAGKEAVFIETDEAGLARVDGGARGPKLVYKALGAHVEAAAEVKADAASLTPGATGEAQTYYLFAHLQPAEGKEQVFNDFYNTTHLPQILSIPGMQWGVRGKLVSQAPESFGAPGYVGIYEFKSYDLKATMAEVDRRMKAGIVKPFPDGAMTPNVLIYFAGPSASAGHSGH